MATSENPIPANANAYIWQPPGKPVTVLLSLDVVDRLTQDVMRGFGAVPKRGAEVGGILLGKTIGGGKLVVGVEDHEMVPIEYRLGPSYLLSEADHAAFQEALDRLREAAQQSGMEPIGFFRSQTRDAIGLTPEDLVMIDRYFPEPDKIVLLIKPFATRVSTAGFYFREDGAFQSGPPLAEFNFRRKDLGGGDPAPPRNMPQGPIPGPASAKIDFKPMPVASLPAQPVTPQPRAVGEPPAEVEVPDALKRPARGGWVWLPISFIFLLLGVLLGFQAALNLRPQTSPGEAFNVGLAVTRDGDNLSVHWDRQAPAIRSAMQGLLVIADGKSIRPVVLTSDQLQTGSVVYPHQSGEVRFRLELTLKSRAVLVQRVDWKE